MLEEDIKGIVTLSSHFPSNIEVDQLKDSKKNIPMWIHHGEEDHLLPLQNIKLDYDLLKEKNFNVLF